MAGTAVAVPNKKSTAVTFNYDAKKFDAAHMAARANQVAKAMGGTELGQGGNFFKPPGVKHSFSKGVWSTGAKKADKAVFDHEENTLVVLHHQISMAWVKWSERTDGKAGKVPTIEGLTNLLDGGDFPDRESLGDLDQDEWEPGMDGKLQDPWKPTMFIPVRSEDGDTIDHIELSTKTANRSGLYLFQKIGEQMAMHLGELPIVKLGTDIYEAAFPVEDKNGNPVIDKKTGKPKIAKTPVHKPTFEIVGWTAMKDCDNPSAEAENVSDEVGEVEAVSRGAAKPEAKKADKPSKRKVVAAEDDEDSI